MMILRFINTSKRIFINIFIILIGSFLSCETYSEETHSFNLPSQAGQILWRCNQGLCNTYLKLKNNDKVVIAENSSPPSVASLDENLISIFFSCGSPCNYTKYYNIKKGISRPFEFAVAVDTKRKIVILAKKNNLVAYNMFTDIKKPLFSIKRNWAPTVALYSDIIEAKFIKGALYIKYLEGDRYFEKEEVIHNLHGKV